MIVDSLSGEYSTFWEPMHYCSIKILSIRNILPLKEANATAIITTSHLKTWNYSFSLSSFNKPNAKYSIQTNYNFKGAVDFTSTSKKVGVCTNNINSLSNRGDKDIIKLLMACQCCNLLQMEIQCLRVDHKKREPILRENMNNNTGGNEVWSYKACLVELMTFIDNDEENSVDTTFSPDCLHWISWNSIAVFLN